MTTGDKIKALKNAGYGVFISHKRPLIDGPTDVFVTRWDIRDQPGSAFRLNGGVTTAAITNNVGDVLAETVALCSEKDRFNKKIALEIAFGRALHKAFGREAIKRLKKNPNLFEQFNLSAN